MKQRKRSKIKGNLYFRNYCHDLFNPNIERTSYNSHPFIFILIFAVATGSFAQERKMMLQTATFGTGCFWCTEAIFSELKGVEKVVSGYAGGHVKNPSYKEVCNGTTGHAEAVQITFDPVVISYEELLEVFWRVHDPTTLNRQGNDVGPQYRSVIFYHNDEQRRLAEHYRKKLNESGAWNQPVVTEISKFTNFYKAEDYHQDYYNNNPEQGYCTVVIRPKLEEFRKVFWRKLKESSAR